MLKCNKVQKHECEKPVFTHFGKICKNLSRWMFWVFFMKSANLNIVTLGGIPPFDLLLLELNTQITSSNALAKVKSSTTFCVSSVLWQRHQTDRLPRVAVLDQPTASAAGGSYVPTLYYTRVSAVSSFWRTTAGDLRSLHHEGCYRPERR